MKVRADVGQAEQLYAELQCGIQHAREVRRLEAGVEAVTNWVLGPGADLLRQLVLRGIGADPDSVLSLQQDLEHLELKCRVSPFFRVSWHYRFHVVFITKRNGKRLSLDMSTSY